MNTEYALVGDAVGLWSATDHLGIVHWSWVQANNLELTKRGYSWATTMCIISALADKQMKRVTCLFCVAKDTTALPFEDIP